MENTITRSELEAVRKLAQGGEVAGDQHVAGKLTVDQGIGAFGYAPPTVQPTVTDATGGTVIDVQARSTLAEILTALRANGLIAPPEL